MIEQHTVLDNFIIDDTTLIAYVSDEAEISVPEGVTLIKNGVFRKKKNLKKVTLPNTLQHIEHEAFVWCEVTA